jgi:hypothetical protein
MSELQTPIALAPASEEDVSAEAQQHEDVPPPPPISEQEVGEYREQDRFLPVHSHFHTLVSELDRSTKDSLADRKCFAHNEIVRAFVRQDRQRR